MKRWGRIPVLVLTMIFLILISGCQKKQSNRSDVDGTEKGGDDSITLSGTIIQRTDNAVLVLENQEDESVTGLYFVSIDKVPVTDSDKEELKSEDLVTGMEIAVRYDGQVLETYPGQINGASQIIIKEQTGDLIGMYLHAIKEIFDEDPGLNSEIKTIALDFSELTSLTESQRSALTYLVECNYDYEIRCATFKELEEEGLIKDLYYEDGIIISLSDNGVNDGRFYFKIKKWRSGLGAIGYDRCKAYKKDDIWEYSRSGAWIS